MAFKMKNPSIAKMVKMAGDNRTAMKMKAEEAAAMKMKKAAMKLREEAAMKKAHEAAMKLKKESAMKAAKPDFPDIDGDGNTSESMKKAAADKKSGMKMKKSPAKMGHSPKKMKKSAMKLDKNKEGSYTTHGNPSKYTTASGESVSSANIDEGNLSTVKTGSDGRKFVVVQDATEKFKAGTKLYLPKDSAAKMKKSAMKLKTFERKSGDLTQSEEARRRDRGEGRNPKQDRRNFYNEKKTRRKVEKSRKADAKARTAMAEFDAKAPKTKAAQDAMSAKDAKKVGKLGKKAAKAEKKARVKEAVASRQLSKQGSDPNRPEVKTRMGKGIDVDVKLPGRSNVAKGQRKFGTKTAGNIGRRKSTPDKGGVSVKVVDKERRDNTATRQARKAYRQKTGLRGAVNVRRKAKGKDVI